jgi:hypothetical protein
MNTARNSLGSLGSHHSLTAWARALPLSLVLVSGCQCDREVTEVPGNLTGKVCDDDGRPLVSAALTVTGRATREGLSNGLGEYSFSGLFPGKYTVTATLGALTRTFPDIEVVARATAVVTDTACRDDPPPADVGDLSGQICNRHTGEIVTDGHLSVTLPNGESIEGDTNPDGTFLIEDIPAGDHVVTIVGNGYQRSFAISIAVDEVTLLDLADDCDSVELGEGGIVGSFCDPNTGENLVNGTVTVSDGPPGQGVQEDILDIDGEFEINGLLPGEYRVEVSAPGYQFLLPDVQVVAGELTPITDDASCGTRPEVGTVQGQICDTDAFGVFVGSVDLQQDGNVLQTVQTNAQGLFQFVGVSAGTYDVRFYRAGYERLFTGIVVTAFTESFVQEANCPQPEAECSEFVNEPDTQSDGRILLVVDRSGSMGETFSGSNDQKWEATRDVLVNVTQSLTSSVEFGLVLYPARAGDVCDEGTQVLGMGLNNASQIETQLNLTVPNGGTPTAPTLAVARDLVAPLANDDRPIAVVLATDGGPNCNESNTNGSCVCTDPDAPPGGCAPINCLDNVNAYNQVSAIKDLGVNTFVVGITGVESFNFVLDEMAVRGGTARPGSPKFYPANDQTALESALAEITERIVACRVQAPAGTNLTQVDSITVSVGGQVVARDNARQNGWALTGTSVIELFGSACDLAVSSADEVSVETCIDP